LEQRLQNNSFVPATVMNHHQCFNAEAAVGERTRLLSLEKECFGDEWSLGEEENDEHERLQNPRPSVAYHSLDFDRIVNEYSTAAALERHCKVFQSKKQNKHNKQQQKYGCHSSGDDGTKLAASERAEQEVRFSNLGFIATRWVLTILVGLCTGLTAVVILHFVEVLVEFRVDTLNRQLQFISKENNANQDLMGSTSNEEVPSRWFDYAAVTFGMPGVYAGYMILNLFLVITSSILCLTFAPAAVGSGIPEVMAYLNGVQVGDFDSPKLFVVKLIGTIFSVASGLVIGPEGPAVHLGSILGACITRLGDLEFVLRRFRQRHPAEARQCGCDEIKTIDRDEDDIILGDEYDDGEYEIGDFLDDDESEDEEMDTGGSWISYISFYLSHFRNDLERRNLISVGAASGFASAFGAPVGGLLYSFEEASSFFDHAMLWKTLVGTVLATCCIAISNGDFTKYSMLSLEIGVQEEDLRARFGEVPLYVVMGVLGGILGGSFNNTYRYVNHKRKEFYGKLAHDKKRYVACKLLESALVSLLTSAVMLTVPLRASWACKRLTRKVAKQEILSAQAYVHRYNCHEKRYINEIGSILFGSREASIKDILTDPESFEPATLLTVAIVFLSLMTVTFGISVPSGMFMPTVLTGSCLGGYLGCEFQKHLISTVHPSDFALIGAAAFLSGMQRNVVSLCVILMEGTGQTKAIIPIIITVVCARSVGDFFSEGIYEIGIELKEYPYLEHGEKFIYDAFSAKDVMAKNIDCLNLVERAGSVEALLHRSNHQAFPVVNNKDGQYRGMVRRDQLVVALACKLFLETSGIDQDIEDPRVSFGGLHDEPLLVCSLHKEKRLSLNRISSAPGAFSPWLQDNVFVDGSEEEGTKLLFGVDATLPSGMLARSFRTVTKTVEGKGIPSISEEEYDLHIDIGSLMNRGALSVSAAYPLSKTIHTFSSLGLRHLPVLTPGGLVAGMITRHDLSDEHIMTMIGEKLK
jgi:H+/Cl- antiporter ClcA